VAQHASADSILPGGNISPKGITSAANILLVGVDIAHSATSFELIGSDGLPVYGTFINVVVRENQARTLDFYSLIEIDPESYGAAQVNQFSQTGYFTSLTDANYRTDLAGDVGSSAIQRSGDGNTLTFTLSGPLQPGQATYYHFVRTTALQYDAHGATTLLATGGARVKLASFEPVGAAVSLYAPVNLGPIYDYANAHFYSVPNPDMGLNDLGQVSFTANVNGLSQAARWDPDIANGLTGTVTYLPMPSGGVFSIAGGINGKGVITGATYFGTDALSSADACLWKGTSVTDLGVIQGDYFSRGFGIDDAGDVCGAGRSSASGEAFVWHAGSFSVLPADGGYASAYAINATGLVAGYYQDLAFGTLDPCVWKPGATAPVSIRSAGTIFGQGVAFDVNAAGIAVGFGNVGGGHTDGFIWDTNKNTVVDLGPGNYAEGINASNQVVLWNSGGAGCLYIGGQICPLSDFVPPQWGIGLPWAINKSGQIVAIGSEYPLPYTTQYGILLTPVHITKVSPAKRPTVGFTLTLGGTGFEAGAQVLWDGVPLTIVSATETSIKATVTSAEAALPGPINLAVVNGDGTATLLAVH
jgi:hypothetical protein